MSMYCPVLLWLMGLCVGQNKSRLRSPPTASTNNHDYQKYERFIRFVS
jgi:hypothetical protein